MKNSGYCGIGIEHGKTAYNYHTLFRTAQVFDADFLFVVGARFRKASADVFCSWRHMPVFSYVDFDDFSAHRPHDCRLVGVEMDERAIMLKDYKHRKRAVYLLGAEDHGLSKKALSACQELIRLPGERSLNVAVAGSVVLYDRLVKRISLSVGYTGSH